MAVRITSMVLRVAVLLALVLGLLVWFNIAKSSLKDVHMLLGIIVVLSLWVLGGFIVATKGGIGIGIGAFVLGLVVFLFGLTQEGIPPTGNLHWIIQVIHLLLGLSAAGMGEMIAGRYKRLNVATQSAQQQ
jgi:hypothetical protein